LLMTLPVLFNWTRILILLLGFTAFALAFAYMYATEAKKVRTK
jgi:ABC-type antimicrobial peptide transport system permease subunit